MNGFNIYAIGVGGQGIGLFSEVLLRAADHAGLVVKGVDTHGLAQRGGVVVSHIRIGQQAHSPLISKGQADMVAALERHEALRGLNDFLKDGGTLVYYNAEWQPLDVRLNKTGPVSEQTIQKECDRRGVRGIVVAHPDLADARMQNVVLLAEIARRALIPGVARDHFKSALADLMEGPMLEKNAALFDQWAAAQIVYPQI